MDLRRFARGQPCQIRLPGVCADDGDHSTVVLAHYRLAGLSGFGLKAPDVLGAWSCSSCHDAVDRRRYDLERDYVRLAHLEGMARTIYQLVKEGVVKW